MKYFLFYSSFLSICISSTNALGISNWDKTYKAVKPSVPVIISSGSVCSGALIEKNLVVTASHCVDSLRQILIMWPENPNHYETDVKVVAIDKDMDLAILRIPSQLRTPFTMTNPLLPLEAGTEIATIGHPIRLQYDLRDVFFFNREETYLFSSAHISGEKNGRYYTNLKISFGYEGGPAFDQNGNLVGTVTIRRIGGIHAGADIGFITGAKAIYNLKNTIPSNEDYELPWHKAQITGSGLIAYSEHQYLTQNRIDSSTFNIGLSIDVWDRFRLETSQSLNKNPSFRDYGFGYKSEFVLPNLSTLEASFGYNYVEYSWENSGQPWVLKNGSGPNISLYWRGKVDRLGFPVMLKYQITEIQSKQYSIFSLLLPIR